MAKPAGRTLIIGYGNPLRGDDRLGWTVVEALEARGANHRIMAVHQLLPEFAVTLSEVDQVIFIDAMVPDPSQDPAPSPDIRVRSLTPDPDGQVASHHMTPEVLLAMTAMLYGRVPRAHLVTVTGERFEHSEALSREVLATIPVVCDLVEELLLDEEQNLAQ